MTFRIKVLTMVVAGVLAVNAVAPSLDSGTLDVQTLSQAWETQSILFAYSSFSVLPLLMVNQLFLDATAAADAKTTKKPDPKKKQEKSPVKSYITSEEYSTFNKRIKKSAYTSFIVPLRAIRNMSPQSLPVPCIPDGFLIVYFLILLTLLPRGNIEDNIRIRFNRAV